MDSKQVEVTDKDGNTRAATLLLCDQCGGDLFMIYKIGEHDHLQCALCGKSFCDGTCGDTAGAVL